MVVNANLRIALSFPDYEPHGQIKLLSYQAPLNDGKIDLWSIDLEELASGMSRTYGFGMSGRHNKTERTGI